jgi:hypothetical protein
VTEESASGPGAGIRRAELVALLSLGTDLGLANWERCRYDWATPGAVTATVVDSNVYQPGSSCWVLRAAPDAGGSRIEMIWVREFRSGPRGRIFGTLFRPHLHPLRQADRPQPRIPRDRWPVSRGRTIPGRGPATARRRAPRRRPGRPLTGAVNRCIELIRSPPASHPDSGTTPAREGLQPVAVQRMAMPYPTQCSARHQIRGSVDGRGFGNHQRTIELMSRTNIKTVALKSARP